MNQLVISISIILLPGIISVVICDKLTVHSKWTSFKTILYSFVLGTLSYVVLQMIYYLPNFLDQYSFITGSFTHLNIWDIATDSKIKIDAWEVLFATLLSVPVAIVASLIINKKVINRLGQKYKITTKYGDENLFSHYLNAQEVDWVYVKDPEKNMTYEGRVYEFSENDDIQEIVLSNVTVYGYGDSRAYYRLPTIYLTKRTGHFIIEALPAKPIEKRRDDDK